MLRNVKIAYESIFANKIRALLTALGIIFGVAAVIAMLAVGTGAQKQVLDQLKLVGVNNIIVQSVYEEEEDAGEEAQSGNELDVKPYSPGLSLLDHANIKNVLPEIKYISSEVAFDCYAYSKQLRKKTKAIGIHSDYFKIFGVQLEKGQFFVGYHNKQKKNVCLLGSKIAKQLFPKSSALNQTIRIGSLNLKVIGVLKNQSGIDENLQSLGINGNNEDIYLPIQTLVLRYKNRSNVQLFDRWSWDDEGGDQNKNQLDKIIIQLNESKYVESSAQFLSKLIARRHNAQEDFKISIPEQILKQQKETDDIFNWLLGAIAGISLLVGGIGIMNIMLASVLERIREIGLRKAVGARTNDIKMQFVLEASFLSLGGGLIGIVLGVSLSYMIDILLDMPTKISTFSIFLSFFISVLTGVIFGYLPAKRAAEQNPLNSLKHD